VYDAGFGRAYGGSGPEEEDEDGRGAVDSDAKDASRDSRVAWASTQGNRGVDDE
jgi:hypothetical protein